MFWKRRSRREEAADADVTALLQEIDLIEGTLKARVYCHGEPSLDGIVPCWTYVSDGLVATGQREIIITVRRGARDSVTGFPEDPLHYLANIHGLASQGRFVEELNISQGPSPLLLGCRNILYVRSRPLHGVPLPDACLSAMPLCDEDMEVKLRCGSLRLLSNLGQMTHYFPWPPWTDLDRPAVPAAHGMPDSLLSRFPVLELPWATACKEGDILRVRLLPRHGDILHNAGLELEPGTPRAILMDLEPAADACFVWGPGTKRPEAIAAAGSQGRSIAACFVAFVESDEGNEVRQVEDGFICFLTKDKHERFERCLVDRETLQVSCNSECDLAVEWICDEFENPCDGKRYASSTGFRDFEPANQEPAREGAAVDSGGVFCLTSLDDVDVSVLGSLHETIDARVLGFFEPRGDVSGVDILLQVDVDAGGSVRLRAAVRPSEWYTLLPELVQSLESIPYPTLLPGAIGFVEFFRVRGGTGLPMPWRCGMSLRELEGSGRGRRELAWTSDMGQWEHAGRGR